MLTKLTLLFALQAGQIASAAYIPLSASQAEKVGINPINGLPIGATRTTIYVIPIPAKSTNIDHAKPLNDGVAHGSGKKKHHVHAHIKQQIGALNPKIHARIVESANTTLAAPGGVETGHTEAHVPVPTSPLENHQNILLEEFNHFGLPFPGLKDLPRSALNVEDVADTNPINGLPPVPIPTYSSGSSSPYNRPDGIDPINNLPPAPTYHTGHNIPKPTVKTINHQPTPSSFGGATYGFDATGGIVIAPLEPTFINGHKTYIPVPLSGTPNPDFPIEAPTPPTPKSRNTLENDTRLRPSTEVKTTTFPHPSEHATPTGLPEPKKESIHPIPGVDC